MIRGEDRRWFTLRQRAVMLVALAVILVYAGVRAALHESVIPDPASVSAPTDLE